ncbi:MAG TPA: molybdopterin-binding protein [Aestuariivirgaceae bacterium]|nr:molybdopterin-binding protein [Aestuariivirgaceae bacterium]
MTSPTAGLVLIGDEILSGRTKDRNLGYIADFLTALGIDLKEARVVADSEPDIIAAVNALRTKYSYVFTTGGIGPTHDDITADAVAKAFGVKIDHDPRAVAILKAHYEPGMLNEARMRMARIPQGAELIENPVSKAPGFRIGNVFVMAGVPKIMQAMLEAIGSQLERGQPMLSATVTANIGEGDLAKPLKEIQERHPDVVIGSYPFEEQGKYGSNLVLRSRDPERLEAAAGEVEEMTQALKTSGKVKVWS